MRTSILLAAATATTLVLASIGPSAVAQGMGGGPMMSSPPPAAKAVPKKKSPARGYLPRAGAKGPGRCGTHMYWKAGKCHDARLPKK
jgi:hypothetical protein